jgi:hypothetical protein
VVPQKTLLSFTDVPKIQTLIPLKSHKTEVIETPLSASERKPGIQGGVLNGRKRRDKIEDVPLHRE